MTAKDVVSTYQHIVHQFEGKNFYIANSPGVDYSYLGINMLDPMLKDKRVRHAIG